MKLTLSTCTADYVALYVRATIESAEYNDRIDDRKHLDVKVFDATGIFSVDFVWITGIIKSTSNDPTMDDSYRQIQRVGFCIEKTESFRKLTKEIMDVIDEVCKEPFDEEMEREVHHE